MIWNICKQSSDYHIFLTQFQCPPLEKLDKNTQLREGLVHIDSFRVRIDFWHYTAWMGSQL